MRHAPTSLLLVLAVSGWGGCDWMWPSEATYDPRRCSHVCAAGTACINGSCQPYCKFSCTDAQLCGPKGCVDRDAQPPVAGNKDGTFYLDGKQVLDSNGCIDDKMEPNNSGKMAYVLPAKTALHSKLAICPPGDVDQYSIVLGKTQDLVVYLLFSPGDGDLDLAVISPFGKVVSSRSVANTEVIALKDALPGRYIIGVWGHANNTITYRLQIAVN